MIHLCLEFFFRALYLCTQHHVDRYTECRHAYRMLTCIHVLDTSLYTHMWHFLDKIAASYREHMITVSYREHKIAASY